MNKINLIIAKRNRDDYLNLVLHNFNLSNQNKKHDVAVYIGEDIRENINKFNYSKYHNLKIEHIYVPNLPEAQGLFCKANILNTLLIKMRQDYDFVCVVDTDMVYRNDFFDLISSILKSGQSMENLLFSLGAYTDANTDYKKIQRDRFSYDAIIKSTSHKAWTAGHSQISITRAYHEHIKKILSIQSIYDTKSLGHNYIGYGGEDTLVKWILQSSKAKVIKLPDIWVHVWHERGQVTKETKRRNKRLTKLLMRKVTQQLKAANFYTNRHLRKIKDLLS